MRTRNTATTTPRDPDLKRWHQTGGGTFNMGRRVIKPKEVFWAKEEEIPLAFRDTIKCLDGEPTGKKEKPVEVVRSKYSKVEKTPGYFNIIDANGKVMNDAGLREAKADELLAQLEA